MISYDSVYHLLCKLLNADENSALKWALADGLDPVRNCGEYFLVFRGLEKRVGSRLTMQDNHIEPDLGALYQLQDAICLLASSSEVQADYLHRHGYGECLDELALNFGAWYQTDETWEFHRILMDGQLAALEPLDKQLDRMSGEENEELWSTDALDGSEWMMVRQLAREALRAFGYEFHPELRRELSHRWPDSWIVAW